jgi:hypothetical protein
VTASPITYDPATDTMLVELRAWPGGSPTTPGAGGEDAGDDLVVHHAPDVEPWALEIEHASEHPELVAEALRKLRSASGLADAA